jgi:hypothetical protein
MWQKLSEDETLWRMLCKKRWSLKKKQDSDYATHYCYWKFQYWLYLCKVPRYPLFFSHLPPALL